MAPTFKFKFEQIENFINTVKGITGNGTLAPEKTMMELKSDIDTINTNFPDNVKLELNATGEAPLYACRAWVKFNGMAGSVSIIKSGNIDSITDHSTGVYTFNFIDDMPDTDYTFFGTGTGGGAHYGIFGSSVGGGVIMNVGSLKCSACYVTTLGGAMTPHQVATGYVAIFR